MRDRFQIKILSYLARGESAQIVAPPGFGKSRFGRSLGGLFLDPNFLDRLLLAQYLPLFSYLKAIRDENRGRLAFVFLTPKLIGPQHRPALGDLYEIVSEHIEFLPPLDTSEYDLSGFSPTPKQLKEIEKLSGGIPALVKICVLAMRDGTSLQIEHNPKLAAQLQEIVETITDQTPQESLFKSKLFSDFWEKYSPKSLSASETRLLETLLAHQGQIVSRDQIATTVYPDVKNYAGVSNHAIDQLVHRLRAKVSGKYSLTAHRGLGYKLT